MFVAAIQNSHFLSLARENQAQIFDFSWGNDQNLEHRCICKNLLIAINALIKKKWEDLQKNPPLGPFGFQEACSRIKNKYSVTGSYPESFNYLMLFRALNREWGMVRMKIHPGALQVTSSFQAELQAHLHQHLNEFSLSQIWQRSLPKLYPFTWTMPNVPSIRECLSKPLIQTVLSSIDKMDFSDLGIRYIPIELCYFCGLTELKLSHNHIDFLPDFIGNFKDLQVLNLEDNDLQELPESFPNWTHLKEVNLKDNPLNGRGLQQLVEWKKNVAALQTQVPMEIA